jgi:hypothetical protein
VVRGRVAGDGGVPGGEGAPPVSRPWVRCVLTATQVAQFGFRLVGNLYCPQTPRPLLELGPTPPSAASEQTAAHDQQTLTIPPPVAAKTRHKHDYPSADWRHSCTRRTSAERASSTLKDTATTTITRGWCRLLGLTPLMLWLACTLAIRNPAHPHHLPQPAGRQRPTCAGNETGSEWSTEPTAT